MDNKFFESDKEALIYVDIFSFKRHEPLSGNCQSTYLVIALARAGKKRYQLQIFEKQRTSIILVPLKPSTWHWSRKHLLSVYSLAAAVYFRNSASGDTGKHPFYAS